MVRTIEGDLQGQGLKVAIVASRFNSFIQDRLVEGALDALRRHGVQEKDITLVKVPGSFELPLAVRRASAGKVDAVIALGALIRGGTPHFEYLSAEVTKGGAQAGLGSGGPGAAPPLCCGGPPRARGGEFEGGGAGGGGETGEGVPDPVPRGGRTGGGD